MQLMQKQNSANALKTLNLKGFISINVQLVDNQIDIRKTEIYSQNS